MGDDSLLSYQFLHVYPNLTHDHVEFLSLGSQAHNLRVVIKRIGVRQIQHYRELAVEVSVKVEPNVFVDISNTSEFKQLVDEVDDVLEVHQNVERVLQLIVEVHQVRVLVLIVKPLNAQVHLDDGLVEGEQVAPGGADILDGRLVHVVVGGTVEAVYHQTMIQSLPTICIELLVVDGVFHVCRLHL